MTILVCGSEGDWALYENTLNSLGADTKRRGSVLLTTGNQMFKTFPASNDIWVHVRLAMQVSSGGISTTQAPIAVRSNGTTIIDVEETGTTGNSQNTLRIRRQQTSGGTLITNAELFPYTSDQWVNWDFRIQRSTTTITDDTLTFSVYRDEVLRFQETNVSPSAWPQPNQILLLPRNTGSNNDSTYFQDVIVTDALPTVGMELATLVPSAVGNYAQFTNNYTNIDDLGYNQSTVISASATNLRESWIFSTPTFTLGNKVIYGVVTNTVGQTDVANTVSDFRPFLRIGGTDYNAAAPLGANNIAPDSYVTTFTTNPATGQPWLQSQLTGLEAGLLTE